MTGEPHSSATGISSWRVWLPALVLIAVALLQMVLTRTADLSPWKGGGFGMFATIDGTAFRHLRIIVEAPERSEELEIAPSQEILAAQVRLFPSDPMFAALAKAVVTREQRYERPVATVRIEVWRAEFNEHLEATDRPLRIFTWDVDQSPDNPR